MSGHLGFEIWDLGFRNAGSLLVRSKSQHSSRHSQFPIPISQFQLPNAFTLIELLVVIAIIAILAAMLFPVFATAKESGNKARCAAQLKQLISAAMAYADDNSGRYVPAAKDVWSSGGGKWRWHGHRDDVSKPFDARKGPLWLYMSRSGGLKQCPSLRRFKTNDQSSGGLIAFEEGCGGFGYNASYVGGTFYRTYPDGDYHSKYEVASTTSNIACPTRTVMFADSAMANMDVSGPALIEYSFCEPPYIVTPDGAQTMISSPSIHFRHNSCANVAWCDGHVSSEKMSWTRTNIYGVDGRPFSIGWFGPRDNSLFDNK